MSLIRHAGVVSSAGAAILLLLDEAGLGSAGAAYSVRKVHPSATNALRARRSSDNAELDVGFVGEDLDTASLTAFVGAGDGFVTTWYDQSGNTGRDVIQATAGLQPQIVSSGTVITINGKPALNSTLSGRYLADATSDKSYFLGSSYENFVHIIQQWNSGNNVTASFGTAGAFQAHIPLVGNIYYDGGDNGAAGRRVVVAQPAGFADTQQLLALFADGSTGYIRANGTELINEAVQNGSGTSGAINFGICGSSATPFYGHQQEMVFWPLDGTAMYAAAEANANAYFGVF